MNCTTQSLTNLSAGLRAFSKKQKLALLVLYTYRIQNPNTVGQVIPAATLMRNAQCLACNDSNMNDGSAVLDFEAMIARQAAINAGAAEPAVNGNSLRRQINPLSNLSESQLRAILITLKCALV